MKKILIFVVLLALVLIGVFINAPELEKEFLIQRHVNNQSFETQIKTSIRQNNQPFFEHLLLKKNRLENVGGLQQQFVTAIDYGNSDFIKLLVNKYNIDINEFLSKEPSKLNQLLRQEQLTTFDAIISLVDPTKSEKIIENIFEQETLLFLEPPISEPPTSENKYNKKNFFEVQGVTSKMLNLYKPDMHDPLLITLLNQAVGLAQDTLVKEILDYGVNPMFANEDGMTPLHAFFLLTPRVPDEKSQAQQEVQKILNDKTKKESQRKAALFIDKHIKLNEQYLKNDNAFSMNQQNFFKEHSEEKTNILRYLVDSGASLRDIKIHNQHPFDLLADIGASSVFIPLLGYKNIAYNKKNLTFHAVENIDLPLFEALQKHTKINPKWRNKSEENLLMVLLKYDILRKHQVSVIHETIAILSNRKNTPYLSRDTNEMLAMSNRFQTKAKNREVASAQIKAILQKQRTIAEELLKAGINPNTVTPKGYSAADYLFPNQMDRGRFELTMDYRYLTKALKDASLMVDLLLKHGLSKKTVLKYDGYEPVHSLFVSLPAFTRFRFIGEYLLTR